MPGCTKAAAWLLGAGLLAATGEARAQARPVVAEVTGGWAGFVDDATQHHAVIGGAVRIPLASRLSVGPEITYMRGPWRDRDWFALGSLWIDLVPETREARVVPFVVVGGGYVHQHDGFGGDPHEGSFTAGGGVRAHVTERISVGGEVRIGWELHLRTTATMGIRLGPP